MTSPVFTERQAQNIDQSAIIRWRFSNMETIILALARQVIARRDPDLIQVLPDQVSFSLDMWLAMHRDLKSSRCVALLFEHLSRMLTEYLATIDDHVRK